MKVINIILLAIPFIVLLFGITLYNRSSPSLGGFPFFYWFQMLWIFLTALFTSIVYLNERKEMVISMYNDLDYILFFGLIGFAIVVGFLAVFWKRVASLENELEYGLAGRRFGTVIIWFLIGGDIYTAYTLIAVPGLEASAGGLAMFAVPYVVLVYPLVYIFMPKLWAVSKNKGYITAGDYVKDRFSSRFLALLVGLTGVVAEMPYIALQIVGIEVLLDSMKLPVELSLIVAFLFVAGFTLISGLRGPALTAIVKDVLIWAAVLTIIIVVPIKLGGFGTIFSEANWQD